MTDQLPATLAPRGELVAQIRRPEFQEQVALALPEGMPPQRFVRAAVTALLQNPGLVGCQPDSLFMALLRAAQDGLLPDGREAALVKFKQKGEAEPRAQYLPMIGGYRKIAAAHGWALRTQIVYEADEFSYELGAEPLLRHVPAPLGQERGPMVAAYAVASRRGSDPEFLVMNAEEIAKVKASSRAAGAGPWVDWPERMWEKTVGKRLFAKLPLGGDPRARGVLEEGFTPAEAAQLVYGGKTPEAPHALPARADAAPPSGEPAPAEGGASVSDVRAEAPPAAFSGPEPPAPEPYTGAEAGEEPPPGWDIVLEPEFTRHAGATLGEVAETGDLEYLAWLASDAIADEALRGAAQDVLAHVGGA